MIFIMCSRNKAHSDQLQDFSYYFSVRITVCIAEQLKWILITKQKKKVSDTVKRKGK